MRGRVALALGLATAMAAALAAAGDAKPRAVGTQPSSAMPASAESVSTVIADLDREESLLKQKMKSMARRSERARAMTTARGRAYARLVRAGLLPVGGGFDALVNHASRLERIRRALRRDVEAERRIAGERLHAARRLEGLAARRSMLSHERESLARSHNVILAAQEREQAFERAFKSDWTPDRHTAVYSAAGSVSPSGVADGFPAMKGRLPFPMTGRTEIQRIRRKSANGPGLEMEARIGAAVKAVYPGRIAFADDYADYGKTVIVDHGGGFYTVSAGLSDVDIGVSDEVATGDRLGSMGAGPGGARLYFEVRQGSDTLEPAQWFGI